MSSIFWGFFCQKMFTLSFYICSGLMTASLLETFYDKMLGIQHYSSFVYPVCRSFSFICGIVVMCRCDVGAVGLLKHTLQWKRKIRAKFRHKKTRLKLLKDTDSVVQTSNNLKLSKPFTLNQIQSLAKGQHWQEETKKIPLNPSTTNFPSAAPASEKKRAWNGCDGRFTDEKRWGENIRSDKRGQGASDSWVKTEVMFNSR